MIVRKFSDAKPYEAPNHRGYSSLRLFGAEAGGSKEMIVGLSHFLPGGGAGPDASPPEKVYFVVSGELTVIVDGKESVLKANDSCYIGAERDARDHQSQQRCLHHRGGNAAAARMIAASFRRAKSRAIQHYRDLWRMDRRSPSACRGMTSAGEQPCRNHF